LSDGEYLVTDSAAPLYRLALGAFLGLKFNRPSNLALNSPEVFAKAVFEEGEFEEGQRQAERALLKINPSTVLK
jgi:hypothetical protein